MNRCICDESDLIDSAEGLRLGPPSWLHAILFVLLVLLIVTAVMVATRPAV